MIDTRNEHRYAVVSKVEIRDIDGFPIVYSEDITYFEKYVEAHAFFNMVKADALKLLRKKNGQRHEAHEGNVRFDLQQQKENPEGVKDLWGMVARSDYSFSLDK